MKLPTNKSYIAIIDFEATCSRDNTIPRNEMEIIEIGAIVIDNNFVKIDEYSSFIKPVRNPILTNFCSELTSITQEQVNNGSSFKDVLDNFQSTFIQDKSKVCFGSWGYYDKRQLQQDCEYHNKDFPFDKEHINIKKWVAKTLNFNKPKGIGSTLHSLGIDRIGTPHRGIDDVRNILQILKFIRDKE